MQFILIVAFAVGTAGVIARRIQFLHQLDADPNRELRFQRRVRLLSNLMIALLIGPLVFCLLLG